MTTVLMAHTIPRFIHHPHSPLSVLLPPPTTTPSLFSNHHHTPQGHCAHPLPTLLPHTHTWCGWHVPLWLLSRPVCGVCGWHAHPITSSTHTATTTVALPIATPPLFGVCVHGNTCHNQSTPIPTCVCDCGTEPSTMPTNVVINHCAPCQSTTWSFIHHQSPAAAAPTAQGQESVVTQMDEGMEAHTTHSVVESNTANQHTSTHTSGHTKHKPTTNPPHTRTGWMAKGLIAHTCEESEKTTPSK